MKKILVFLLITTSTLVYSKELDIWASSAIIIDYDTEQILFNKDINKKIQPASMTKLVAIFMAYNAIKSGLTTKQSLVNISNNADYKNLPRDSSLMFIEEGQTVTLYELMLGLAIPSGNDAAIAVAEHLFGTVEEYLLHVNRLMKGLGLTELKFVDSSGYSDDNSITASQFAEFCLILIKNHPECLNELLSIDQFIYPKQENGKTSIGGIKQFNHNPLIGIYPNCDGLKTGFINKSGLNVSLTATKNNRRIISVIMGIKDENRDKAELKRVNDAITLLNHGLDNFKNVYLDKIVLPPIKINSKTESYIFPIIPYKRIFTLNKDNSYRYELYNIATNIELGQKLGYVYFKQSGVDYKFPIVSNRQIYNFN